MPKDRVIRSQRAASLLAVGSHVTCRLEKPGVQPASDVTILACVP
jgi:hypothetical protein